MLVKGSDVIMSLTSNKKIFEVNESEYGYNRYGFTPGPVGMNIDVYVPKLTGTIVDEGYKFIKSNKLFINSDECPVKYNDNIYLTKSFYAKLKDNCSWMGKMNSVGIVPANTKFVIEFVNGNIKEAYLTTK